MTLSAIQTKALDILRRRGSMQALSLSLELWPEAERTEPKIAFIGSRYHMAVVYTLLSLHALGLVDQDKTKPIGFWVAVDQPSEEPKS